MDQTENMISLLLFLNLTVLASYDTEYDLCNNIIWSISPCADATISRGDCIAAILKLVGVDKRGAQRLVTDVTYDNPVFDDLEKDRLNEGYIILAKNSNVTVGVTKNANYYGNFEPNRNVTVKECLTFMLRCLKDSDSVIWDNVMTDSVKNGLLQENELDTFVPDEPLLNKDFCMLLSRMLNMNRYLYWPKDASTSGWPERYLSVDERNSIRYIDWISEMKE